MPYWISGSTHAVTSVLYHVPRDFCVAHSEQWIGPKSQYFQKFCLESLYLIIYEVPLSPPPPSSALFLTSASITLLLENLFIGTHDLSVPCVDKLYKGVILGYSL